MYGVLHLTNVQTQQFRRVIGLCRPEGGDNRVSMAVTVDPQGGLIGEVGCKLHMQTEPLQGFYEHLVA